VREKVLQYIRERDLLHAGDRVAVAVSGGADSVALLRVLLALRAELGIVLFVAHFNHQLRGADSDADERFVADLASRHHLQFFTGRADVRQHASSHKLSLEHAARELRYKWLTDLAKQQRLDAVATAHNSDDQAETVLMKFLRGAGTRGLAGIHPILTRGSIRIIRPLLETERSEVECYLHALNQPWREDHTNQDTQFTRNRIRHELLPLLERDYNPGIRRLLAESAEVARGEEDLWNSMLGSECWETRVNRHQLLLGGFERLHLALQRLMLKRFLEWNGLATDFEHIECLRRCALGEGATVSLAGNWQARREGDCLCLRPPRAIEAYAAFQYALPVPGEREVPELKMKLQTAIIPAEAAALETPGSLLRAEGLDVLTLRNWLPGDRFRPAHTGSEARFKQLFAEKRIPAEQRPLWPVVVSGKQIVWVRGFRVAHDFAWRPGSGDALRIEALPSDQAPAATQPT
jgi:tRNA(Ile)-lysidine synthase